jgi:hypothetical protein
MRRGVFTYSRASVPSPRNKHLSGLLPQRMSTALISSTSRSIFLCLLRTIRNFRKRLPASPEKYTGGKRLSQLLPWPMPLKGSHNWKYYGSKVLAIQVQIKVPTLARNIEEYGIASHVHGEPGLPNHVHPLLNQPNFPLPYRGSNFSLTSTCEVGSIPI